MNKQNIIFIVYPATGAGLIDTWIYVGLCTLMQIFRDASSMLYRTLGKFEMGSEITRGFITGSELVADLFRPRTITQSRILLFIV